MASRRRRLDPVGPFGNPDGSRADIEDLISELKGQADLSHADGRARFSELARPLLARLTEGVYRELVLKQIASALGISEGTVKAYLTPLYEKVGARDRFELALFGLKNLGGRRGNAHTGEPIRSLVARRPEAQ